MYRISLLAAVNEILSAAGEAPITTIAAVDPMSEAQLILNEIDTVSREIQSQGWFFNTNPKVTLLPDTAGRVPIPSNVLSVQRVYSPKIVVRGSYMWDSDANTDIISGSVDIASILLLSFDSLPYSAQNAIIKKAGLNYLAKFDAANDPRFTSIEAMNAMDVLTQEDIDVGGYTYGYNDTTRDIAARPPRYGGGYW